MQSLLSEQWMQVEEGAFENRNDSNAVASHAASQLLCGTASETRMRRVQGEEIGQEWSRSDG